MEQGLLGNGSSKASIISFFDKLNKGETIKSYYAANIEKSVSDKTTGLIDIRKLALKSALQFDSCITDPDKELTRIVESCHEVHAEMLVTQTIHEDESGGEWF